MTNADIALAWQEGWNQGFRDTQAAVVEDGYLSITPTANPYETQRKYQTRNRREMRKQMDVTDEMVATFKAAWEKADNDGRNERSRAGLEAVFAALAATETPIHD